MPPLHTFLDGKVRSCFVMYPHPVSRREQIFNNTCSVEFPNLLQSPVLLLGLRPRTYNSLSPGHSEMPFSLKPASPPNMCISAGYSCLAFSRSSMTHCFEPVIHYVLKLLLGNVSCTGPFLPVLTASIVFQIFNRSQLDHCNSFLAEMAREKVTTLYRVPGICVCSSFTPSYLILLTVILSWYCVLCFISKKTELKRNCPR